MTAFCFVGLDIALFGMNSAYEKGGCKFKSTLHMAQEYCLLEGVPYHLEEGGFLLKGILHFSEDSSIVFRGIEKHCTFSKEECN